MYQNVKLSFSTNFIYISSCRYLRKPIAPIGIPESINLCEIIFIRGKSVCLAKLKNCDHLSIEDLQQNWPSWVWFIMKFNGNKSDNCFWNARNPPLPSQSFNFVFGSLLDWKPENLCMYSSWFVRIILFTICVCYINTVGPW